VFVVLKKFPGEITKNYFNQSVRGKSSSIQNFITKVIFISAIICVNCVISIERAKIFRIKMEPINGELIDDFNWF
jgi:hypothetical protein